MKHHHTKNNGDFGVLKVQIDLFEQGYLSFTTVSEHQDFDLIAYKQGGIFKRIQVKYRKLDDKGSLQIPLKSTWVDKHGNHVKQIDKSEIDLYAIYCPDTDKCYYVDPNNFSKTITLRTTYPKNNQRKNINFADDYRRVP